MMFWRRKREQDLDRELRDHLEFEAEEQDGTPLGNVGRIKEDVREAWGWTWLDQLARDASYALRVMRKKPGFTAVAVGSLAIALGANTAVFSFVNAIVLKRLAAPGAERFFIIRQNNQRFHIENCCFKYDFFQALRKRDPDFDDILAVNTADVNLAENDQTEQIQAEVVSGNYFQMLGVHAAVGRLLDESDDAVDGAGQVCVISYRLWKERFGARPDVIGRTAMIDTLPFQIVGVSEPGFSGAALHEPHDLQIPSSMRGQLLGDARNNIGWAQLIARLKPDVQAAQAQARLNALGREIEKVTGPRMAEHDDFFLRDGSQGINSKKEQLGKPVLILLLLVAVVLLIACANVGGLLLAAGVDRAREAGLRIAIGAGRAALLRQFLVESVLLAALAAAIGWPLSRLMIQALLQLLGAQGEGLIASLRPEATIFAFSAGIALLAGIAFGLLPAWRAAHAPPLDAVHGFPSGHPVRRSRLSSAAISSQIALSLAMLFCTGLFAQTLRNLRAIDLGFHPENLVMLHIDLSRTVHKDSAGPYFEDLLRDVRALPQTRAASLANISVLSGSMANVTLRIPGYVPPNRLPPVTNFVVVGNGYFRTLGIPLVAGRDFTPQDRASGPAEGVVIVNEQFARQFFGSDALGKVFSSTGRDLRVVGIVGDTKYRFLREETQPIMYIPVTQGGYRQRLFLQVRTSGDPSRVLADLRTLVQSLDPRMPVDRVGTMEMQIDDALAAERLLNFLSTLIGAVAVSLAALGLYGVLSFAVKRRTREIGIRLAVGAQRGAVLGMILRESTWIVLPGIAAGIPLALLCGNLASSLLYGLQPGDPATLLTSSALLAAVASAAAWLPACRASRVDPLTALRCD
jgi:predicted permease